MATRDLVSLVFTADDRAVQAALTRTDKGLDGLGGQAEKSGGRIQGAFSGAGDSVKGLAGRIPGVGGALSGLVTPAGAATAAIGLVVGGIGAAVGKVSSLEKELRPMIQRSNLSAESLQVLSKAANRLGSEDGLDGVTDSAQELQLRLAEASQDASGPAVAAFEKLGLSSADLIAASPEDSFLQVITALQGVSNASDKKFLADELLGGSSEKLSGIINTSSEEFQGLTDSIRENGDIISNEGIANANQFNIALGKLGGAFGGIASTVGTEFIPILTEIIEGVTEIWQEIDGPVIAVLKIFTGILTNQLRSAFDIIAGVIQVVSSLLRGDFTGAWEGVQRVAQGVSNNIITAFSPVGLAIRFIGDAVKIVASLLRGDFAGAWEGVQRIAASVMNSIITVYNNTIGLIPGVSKIDMVAFADNIEIAEEAADELSAAMAGTGGSGDGGVARAATVMGGAVEETGGQVSTFAAKVLTASERLQAYQDRNSKLREEFTLLYPELVKVNDEIERNAEETETAITWLMLYEAGLLGARQEADLFALSLGKVRTGYSNLPPTDGDGGSGGGGSDGEGVPGGSAAARPAPQGFRFREDIGKDPISQVYTDAEGNPFAFNTTGGGNTQFNIAEVGRLQDALDWLAANTEAVVENTEAVVEETAAVEAETEAVETNTEAVETNTATTETATTETEANTEATETNAVVTAEATEEILTVNDRIAQMTAQVLEAQAAAELEAAALAGLSPEIRAMAEELGLFGLQVEEVAEDVVAATEAIEPPAKTAADRLAEMTAQILETQAATDLEAEALALLSPELRALAEELGLFGLRVVNVAEDIADAADDLPSLGSLTHRQAAFDTRLSPAERKEAAEWAVWQNAQGAQHGAIVLPRMGGTRVNVGEAGRAEAIIPLPDLAALAGNLMAGVGGGMGFGGGMSGSGGGGREVVLALDGERLGSVFLDQFNILQSENRLLVDLV